MKTGELIEKYGCFVITRMKMGGMREGENIQGGLRVKDLDFKRDPDNDKDIEASEKMHIQRRMWAVTVYSNPVPIGVELVGLWDFISDMKKAST